MRDEKVLIAVPALDVMPVRTAYSMLSLKRDCPSRFSFIVQASCHDARNLLAAEAVESGADRVLWLDSDMVFDEDLMIRLGEDLDAGWDMVCGLYFKRELPVTPVIYRDVNAAMHRAEPYLDYPRDAVFPVAGCGFGAVMMTVELLRRVEPLPQSAAPTAPSGREPLPQSAAPTAPSGREPLPQSAVPTAPSGREPLPIPEGGAAGGGGGNWFTPLPGLSEDLSFCWRALRVGARIVCDSRIKVGHVGQIVYGEAMYGGVRS